MTCGIFDCFGLIGGGAEIEEATQRGCSLQVAKFYELKQRIGAMGIVGSSDSHGVVNTTRFRDCFTLLFSAGMDAKQVITDIKDVYTAAVTQFPGEEIRTYGSFRMVKYADFLMQHYIQLHDAICSEEGRILG